MKFTLVSKSLLKKLLSRSLFLLGKIWPSVRLLQSHKSLHECHSYLADLGYPFREYSPSLVNEYLESDILISLIVPVYNAEKYLERLLESVLSQTYKGKFELVLINDGSSDNSQGIIDEYVNRYPNIIRAVKQSNKGISSARNRGIQVSKGKYIGFIDNDDYILPTYLERLSDKITESDFDIIQTGIREENNDGSLISETNKVDASYDKITVASWSNLSGFVWDGVYKRSLFNMATFPDGFWYEDMLSVLLLFQIAKKVAVISDELYVKINHHNNASKVVWNRAKLKSIDQLWLAQQLVDYGIKDLGLCADEILLHSLLYEYGPQLFSRTYGLDYKTRNVIFKCAAIHFNSIQWTAVSKEPFRKEMARALKEENSIKWRLICLSWVLSH